MTAKDPKQSALRKATSWITGKFQRGMVPAGTLTILLAGVIGVLAGFGAILLTLFINLLTGLTVGSASQSTHPLMATGLLVLSPAIGLLIVTWLTRRYAPEAQGHGVPEVITAVARHDGVIRPQVAAVKTLASGICIGMGGSVGREGPIVQIGSALGSTAGQLFRLSARNVKVLLAAGAAAGISATFNAPLAGVVFSSEIILGSFAVESLTPIVIASVLADVVQQHIGEHRYESAFQQLDYDFAASWGELPSFVILGLLAGLAAVAFSKLLYAAEDIAAKHLPRWWVRALVLGTVVGLTGAWYPAVAPTPSLETRNAVARGSQPLPPLWGVGYDVVDHALHLQDLDSSTEITEKSVRVGRPEMLAELSWLVPLILLKPLLTSLTLSGGGSGGIFAPSLYLGAVLGACFGLTANLFFPAFSNDPGVYAIVGMGAVVAGTTHGVLSAILIVYEMTSNYLIILPIMAAAGLASVVSRVIDPESIYYKKLSRRGESIARGHDLHRLDHIMVRDVMIRTFPQLKHTDNVTEIIRVARANPHIESLPVMDADGKMIGIIRSTDLHRVIDSDVMPDLVNAEDIALRTPLSVSPAENLIEALRDFGTRDVETLPVEVGRAKSRQLVGLLLRADVMKRYRQEMLRKN